jgi:hypothetical protein
VGEACAAARPESAGLVLSDAPPGHFATAKSLGRRDSTAPRRAANRPKPLHIYPLSPKLVRVV